jgi:hypothetical protein
VTVRRPSGNELVWEHVRLASYARSVGDWRGWFAAADELHFAAELIKPQVVNWWAGVEAWRKAKPRSRTFPPLGCHSILMMLYGYVVEGVCKGAMARGGQVDVTPATVASTGIPKELKTHSLRQLLRVVGLDCDSSEQELVQRMTRAVVWRGRYPAAVKYKESIHTLVLDDGKRHSATWFGANDVPRMEALITRLRLHVGIARSLTVARDAAP